MYRLTAEEKRLINSLYGIGKHSLIEHLIDETEKAVLAKLCEGQSDKREMIAKWLCLILYPYSYWDGLTKESRAICFEYADQIIPIIGEAVADEIKKGLGLDENELGFCEISNHVPYGVFDKYLKGD